MIRSICTGACGFWGVLSVGIFGSRDNAVFAGYSGADTFVSGEQFAVQLVGALAIMGWTLVTSAILFYGLKRFIGVRVPEEDELQGLDLAHHVPKQLVPMVKEALESRDPEIQMA